MYDPEIDLRLHDVIEVIGIYECAPELALLHFDAMSIYESANWLATHPPSSLVTNIIRCFVHPVLFYWALPISILHWRR